MRILIHRCTQTGHFFKIRALFSIFKKGQGDLSLHPHPLVSSPAPVSYLLGTCLLLVYWILVGQSSWLLQSFLDCIQTRLQLAKITLAVTIFVKRSIVDILQGSEYASGSGYSSVLNIPGFSICQGFEYARFLNIPVL